MVAVDVSAAQLDRARENARKEGVRIAFVETDGLHLPDGSYDAVVLWAQVLGNIESKADQLALLECCRDALSEDGILSASGHNGTFCRQDTPEYTDEHWLYPWGVGELRYHLFTVETFEALFEESGFGIIKTEIPYSLPAIIHTVARLPR